MRQFVRLLRVAASLSAAALAQSAATPGPTETAAQRAAGDRAAIERLLTTLQDDTQRQALVAQLQALLAAQQPAAAAQAPGVVETVAGTLTELSGKVQAALLAVVEQASLVPQRLRELGTVLADAPARARLLGQLGWFALALLVAMAAFALTRLALSRPRAAVLGDGGGGPLARASRIAARALLHLAPAAAALAAGLATATILVRDGATQACIVATLTAAFLKRLSSAGIGLALAPAHPGLRALPLGDAAAQALARQLHRVATLAVFGWLLLALTRVLATDPELSRALAELYAMALLVAVIVVALTNRARTHAFVQARRAEESGGMRGVLWIVLSLWWSLAIAYALAVYLVWAHDVGGGGDFLFGASLWSLAVVVAVIATLGLTRAGVRRLAARARTATARIPEVSARVPLYARIAQTTLDLLVVGLGACLLLEAWGVASLDALRSDAWRSALAALFDVLLVFVLALATIDFATVITQRFIDARVRAGVATAKVRTLVPLARTAIKVVVSTAAALMILTAIGVDIGPLLAGVGIIGLALGFGAQTLVKDIITGVFILLEDTLAVGDVCVLAGASGAIESIGLRSVRLRDIRGVVHTVPFSSVDKVANLTKDFSYCLVEAGVAYSADVDQVIGVLRALGEELRADPVLGPDILEATEIQGLDRFEESAVIVRARLKTKASAQWREGREFNRRMKAAFDAAGIEIPFPYRTVILRREEGAPEIETGR